MLNLSHGNRRFTPSWAMIGLTIVALVFFVKLGVWQLERGQEKERMLAKRSEFTHLKPLDWHSGSPLPSQYQSLQLEGWYRSEVFLLDNQHYRHQLGYSVLSPFQLQDGAVVLVDRGWVVASATRELLQTISYPADVNSVTGVVYYPSINKWLSGDFFDRKINDMLVIEQIKTAGIGDFLHKSIYPFIIRLSKEEPNGFVRDWPMVSMPPARHYAYAFQWFAIAVTIFILFVVLNLKKKETK